MAHAEAQRRCSEADKRGIKQFLVHQIVLVIEHGTAWGANAKCVQLKYAIEVDRGRYRNACAAEEILLWIHKGHVVTVWSSVLRGRRAAHEIKSWGFSTAGSSQQRLRVRPGCRPECRSVKNIDASRSRWDMRING